MRFFKLDLIYVPPNIVSLCACTGANYVVGGKNTGRMIPGITWQQQRCRCTVAAAAALRMRKQFRVGCCCCCCCFSGYSCARARRTCSLCDCTAAVLFCMPPHPETDGRAVGYASHFHVPVLLILSFWLQIFFNRDRCSLFFPADLKPPWHRSEARRIHHDVKASDVGVGHGARSCSSRC